MLPDSEILPLRLRSLGLVGSGFQDATAVASYFLAIQGQVFPASQWALGLRATLTQSAVRTEFDSGRLVRSWPMRGTIHVIAAADLGWFQALMWERVGHRVFRRWFERNEFGLDVVEHGRELVREVLSDGSALTRSELFEHFSQRGVSDNPMLNRGLLHYLCRDSTVTLGPTSGSEHLVVLTESWIAEPRLLSTEEALAELVVRFVRSHGPVTKKDMARWTGLGVGALSQGIADAKDKIVAIPGENGALWYISAELANWSEIEPAKPGVQLLPAFDEHILGYGDRSAQLNPEHEETICPGRNGMFKPTVTLDGATVGTWQAPTPGAIAKLAAHRPVPIIVRPFDTKRARLLGKRAVKRAGDEFARFLGFDEADVSVK